MTKKLWIALIGFAIIWGACSSLKNSQNTANLGGDEWKLVSVKAADSDELIIPSPDRLPTLTFDIEKNTISGSAGCNRVMGPYELKGSSLKFGNIASSMMMCIEHMNLESAVLKALNEINTYKVKNGQLILMKESKVLAIYSR